jgi:hypothetical protein
MIYECRKKKAQGIWARTSGVLEYEVLYEGRVLGTMVGKEATETLVGILNRTRLVLTNPPPVPPTNGGQ